MDKLWHCLAQVKQPLLWQKLCLQVWFIIMHQRLQWSKQLSTLGYNFTSNINKSYDQVFDPLNTYPVCK